MKEEKVKKSGKRIVLKIILAILLSWIMLIVIDFIRFSTSDSYIEPILTLEHIHCSCGESRNERGIGYSFNYSYYIDLDNDSWKYDKEKPDSRSFSIFGWTLYTRK